MSVDEKYKPLVAVMGKQAWETVKNTSGFTPKEALHGKAAKVGLARH